MTKVTLGPETVDKIFMAWKVSDYQIRSGELEAYFIARIWARVDKRYLQEFGDWLWPQGGNLRQDNKKYYIDFRDEAQASFFLLKWL